MANEELEIPGVTIPEELLNTTDGMTVIRNSANDDSTDTVSGANWFRFNGAVASSLYISGNHWVGFGANAEQLRVCRRDGKVYYLYRQEGQISEQISFLKIRWEGYTYYSSTADNVRLIFELFLLSNNDMFLNVIRTPTNSSYYGTSELICNGTTSSLSIVTGDGQGRQISFYHQDEEGRFWDIKYEMYNTYDTFYLIGDGQRLYGLSEEGLIELPITELTPGNFIEYGSKVLPDNALLLPIRDLHVYAWAGGGTVKHLQDQLSYTPSPQIISAIADASDSSIKGIQQMTADYSGQVTLSYSVDGENYSEEEDVETFMDRDMDVFFDSLGSDKRVYFRFKLYGEGRIKAFIMTYKN